MRELGGAAEATGSGRGEAGVGREGAREGREEKVLPGAPEPPEVNLPWAAVAGGGWGGCVAWLVALAACTCPPPRPAWGLGVPGHPQGHHRARCHPGAPR